MPRHNLAVMELRTLNSEQRLGLAAAIAFHGALLALLVFNPLKAPPAPEPERISVTLADSADVAINSAAPLPQAAPAPDQAPVVAEVPEPLPAPLPPKPVVKPEPVAKVVPEPKPLPKPLPKVQPAIKPAAAAKAQPSPNIAQRTIPRPSGASRIGNDFLKGVSGAPATGTAQTAPAAATGPQVRISLAQSLLRQVRPKWQGRVPQGVNTDKIVTILSIELNADGTLAQRPAVMGQEGIDDSNRAQAQRHAEEAIRAVQLSAPFDLPSDLYSAWRKLPPLRFRKST